MSVLFFGCGSPSAQKGETHVVEIKQMKFVPQTLTVAPGDSIKWVNRDIVEHDVVDKTDKLLVSKSLKMGEWYAVKISKSETDGQIDYICTLHPVMKGRIKIEK